MENHTKDTVAALRGELADLTAEDEALNALGRIVQAQSELLDTITNSIVAASSIIAIAPASRHVAGFAGDVIEAAHLALTCVETIDKALDVLVAPYVAKYEGAAHSIKAAT